MYNRYVQHFSTLYQNKEHYSTHAERHKKTESEISNPTAAYKDPKD